MAEQNPTLEGKEQSQPAGQIDVEALLGELQKANINSTQELQGKLNAGREAGHLANIVGDLRKEIAELKSINNVQQPVQRLNLDNVQEGQTINLEGVLENVVNKVMTKKEQEARERQQRVQQAVIEAVNTINNDEDYPLVKEVWEKKMTPDTVFKIQNGQINPVKLYQETVRSFYKEYLKKSQDAIMQLTGKGNVNPPHMESGEQNPQNLISQDKKNVDPAKKLIADVKAQVDKGRVLSNEEELDMVARVLGMG